MFIPVEAHVLCTKCPIGEALIKHHRCGQWFRPSKTDSAKTKNLMSKFSVAKISVRYYFWIHFCRAQFTALMFVFKYFPLLFSKASFTLVELCWEPSTWVLPHSCSHSSRETSCHTETLTHSMMAIRDKLTISFTWHASALCMFKECLQQHNPSWHEGSNQKEKQ